MQICMHFAVLSFNFLILLSFLFIFCAVVKLDTFSMVKWSVRGAPIRWNKMRVLSAVRLDTAEKCRILIELNSWTHLIFFFLRVCVSVSQNETWVNFLCSQLLYLSEANRVRMRARSHFASKLTEYNNVFSGTFVSISNNLYAHHIQITYNSRSNGHYH